MNKPELSDASLYHSPVCLPYKCFFANKGHGGVRFTSSSWLVHSYPGPGMSAVGDVYIHPKTTTKCRSPSLMTQQQKQWSHAFPTSALIGQSCFSSSSQKLALIWIQTVFIWITAFSKYFSKNVNQKCVLTHILWYSILFSYHQKRMKPHGSGHELSTVW